jgi:hypothetical protein
MEYMSRDNRTGAPAAAPHGRRKHIDWAGRAVRIEWFIFTALVALVLLLAIGWLMFSGNSSTTESNQIDNSKCQAVFLNGGATSGSVAYTTYFGHVSKLNNNYMILKDVYYLTTSTTNDNSQAANPQLTKLGCQQLHSPYDEMVINRNQVAFWENLQDSGKVVQAIKQFKAQNPNGPNCSSTNNTTNSTNQSSTSTQQSTTPTNNRNNP